MPGSALANGGEFPRHLGVAGRQCNLGRGYSIMTRMVSRLVSAASGMTMPACTPLRR
jgi:hypothetical protein